MLETITIDMFSPHVEDVFLLHVANAAPVPILLIEVKSTVTDDDPRRQRAPFSVVFRTPVGARFVQGIYHLEREGVQPLDIFLVPIKPDSRGPRLEAVFN